MRHTYYTLFLLIFSLIFIHYNFSQVNDWIEQTITPTPPKLNCVSLNGAIFAYPEEGWIGGDSGTILYTSNSGTNWLYRNNNVIGTNNVNVFQSIPLNQYTNNVKGKALCSSNSSTVTFIYRTTNQGLNWSVVYQQTGGRIRCIYMLDTVNGYILGDPVGGRWTILKTSNGGLSFDSSGLFLVQNGNEISNYNAFYVATSYQLNLMIFGTNSGRLYRSTNFGASWNYFALPFQNAYTVDLGHFFNNSTQGYNNGFAAGSGAVYTTDFGVTWSSVTLPGSGNINTLYQDNSYYYNSEAPYACYAKGSQIYSSTNLSMTFALQYTSPNGGNYTQITLAKYAFEGGLRIGWAVKDNGTVSFYNHYIAGIQKISSDIPKTFSLYQNYPNPFNPITKIKFDIPLSRGVREGRGVSTKLIIYDILGNEVATLVNDNLSPGTYEVECNGSNYSSGVYFYKLTSGNFSETKKLILLK